MVIPEFLPAFAAVFALHQSLGCDLLQIAFIGLPVEGDGLIFAALFERPEGVALE